MQNPKYLSLTENFLNFWTLYFLIEATLLIRDSENRILEIIGGDYGENDCWEIILRFSLIDISHRCLDSVIQFHFQMQCGK